MITNNMETIDMRKYAEHNSKGKKVREIGDPCKKCGTSVILRATKKRKRKKKTTYYYTHYLWCDKCRTIYFIDKYKVDKR